MIFVEIFQQRQDDFRKWSLSASFLNHLLCIKPSDNFKEEDKILQYEIKTTLKLIFKSIVRKLAI